ncbi:MAG: hypothetical protein RSD08_04070, partial [Oscillospiraceae bacterium]
LVFFSAADALVFMWMFGKFKSLNKNQFAAAAVLLLLMLVLCLPLFENSLRIGHDFQFHMLRIEGLKDGILSGQFPVRIHPLENNGYGYATSLFYPELFLIFPALVRIIGFPLDFCYKLFLAAINVCAVLISYYSFLEIFKKRYTALIGAMVYSLSLYRIVNMYLRSAVGELLAMTFFPLIAAALFDILSRPVTSAEFKRGWVFGVAGFCGVIQSHLICTAFAGIFTVLACLCFAKRTFEKQRFKALFKTAFFSVALNLWFIIPLLDMMRGKYNVTVNSFDTYAHSVVPRQLFSIFVSGAGISNELGSEAGEMPLGIGLALIIGIAVFLVVLIAKAMRDKSLCRLGIFSACAGAASLFLTTCLFPWNTFQNLGGFFNSFACALQFPWRFLSTATLFLTLVTCCAASALNAEILKKIFFAIGSAASVFTLVIFFSGYSASFTACGTAAISTCSLGNREYLPIGTNVDMMVQGKPESQFIKVNSYTKSGTEIKMELENPSSIERAVSVPLLYYPGYTAKCADGSLRLGHNAENKVTVLVPAEYSGEVSIGYTGKPIWKIADALTIILAAIFCVFLKREFGSSFRKKQKQTENTSGKKHIYRESEKV